MLNMPLRYNISDWHQLAEAKSNNSRNLHIHVSDMIQSDKLTGTRISVCHDNYGVLFACVLEANGSMISKLNDETTFEFTPKQILAELEKYGFYVTYEPRTHLPGNQITYLITLKDLGFDKLRVLNVWHIENTIKVFRWCVVAFNVKENPKWINNSYAPSEDEFATSLRNGSAINISALSNTHRWSWSWLDYVANIDDILKDNA